jgi:hypothetical protein
MHREELSFPHSRRVAHLLVCGYPEGHRGSIEARRFPRDEIDTEIHAATFGREKQEVVRGRAFNISETGVAG